MAQILGEVDLQLERSAWIVDNILEGLPPDASADDLQARLAEVRAAAPVATARVSG
jgi:hypothetical protein